MAGSPLFMAKPFSSTVGVMLPIKEENEEVNSKAEIIIYISRKYNFLNCKHEDKRLETQSNPVTKAQTAEVRRSSWAFFKTSWFFCLWTIDGVLILQLQSDVA